MYNWANRGYIHNVSAPRIVFQLVSNLGALRHDLTVKVRKHSPALITAALTGICFAGCKTDVRVTVSRTGSGLRYH